MIRLIIWGGLFSAGLWFGIEAHTAVMNGRCLDAGGQIGPRGLCTGVSQDG